MDCPDIKRKGKIKSGCFILFLFREKYVYT